VNFKTFYINRHQIGYQEVLLDDPVFEKAYLLENPKKIDIIAMAVAIKRIISSLACSALPLHSLIAYV